MLDVFELLNNSEMGAVIQRSGNQDTFFHHLSFQPTTNTEHITSLCKEIQSRLFSRLNSFTKTKCWDD